MHRVEKVNQIKVILRAFQQLSIILASQIMYLCPIGAWVVIKSLLKQHL